LVSTVDIKRLCLVSGGFATVQPGNLLSINAVEAFSLEDFSPEAVRSGLAEAQKVASGAGSEEEVAEARIEVEVYEALQVCHQLISTVNV